MSMIRMSRMRLMLCASAIALAGGATASLADTLFTKPVPDFVGRVSAQGVDLSLIHI